jgi:hypothetical protein
VLTTVREKTKEEKPNRIAGKFQVAPGVIRRASAASENMLRYK